MIDLFNSVESIKKTLSVKVTPKASQNRVKIEYNPDGSINLIRVYVTTAPEDGKANKEVIKLLSKELGIPKSRLEITHGLKIRDKVISIINN
tara:strand:- start:10374 stop:10649 length:276 start_codon:yes stop_codon:yes gene_type:complete